jgi:hypothetical protein
MNRTCICCDESEPHTYTNSTFKVDCCNRCFDAGCNLDGCFKVQEPGEPLLPVISTETGIVLIDEDAMVRS